MFRIERWVPVLLLQWVCIRSSEQPLELELRGMSGRYRVIVIRIHTSWLRRDIRAGYPVGNRAVLPARRVRIARGPGRDMFVPEVKRPAWRFGDDFNILEKLCSV